MYLFLTPKGSISSKKIDEQRQCPRKMGEFLFWHVDTGEYYFDAAVRELGEEIGLYNTKDLNLAMIVHARPETGYEHVHLFTCSHDGELKFDVNEVSDGLWIDPEN